jgi:hypothetical protein
VVAGGFRFVADFTAELAFLPRCIGVMITGPSLPLDMTNTRIENKAINEKQSKRRDHLL